MSALTWILLGIDGLVVIALLATVLFLRYFAYSFLALNKPLKTAEILVVEGWLDEPNLSGAISEFKTGNYQYLVTVGGPVSLGSLLSEYKTVAEVAAATIRQLGFDDNKLIALSSRAIPRDRTAHTAITVQNWLSEKKLNIQGINIYSNHAHARRTHFLYEKHLSSDIKVGVIAANPLYYTENKWWETSYGVRIVIMELIAYCYVVLRPLLRK